MKILFIYPNIVDFSCQLGFYNMGIGYLSAMLKREGHSVSLFNIYKSINQHTFIEKVVSEKPDLIAFSTTSHMFPFVSQFCDWFLQEGLQFRTICGGIHATLAPQEVINTNGIDMICIGEGENALVELCGRLQRGEDISDIKNIWLKTNGGIKKNPVRPLIENLDELPFVDRDIFNFQELIHESSGRLPMVVSRGCPYNCSYCCNHTIRSIYPNKNKFIRFRNAENVIREIKSILGRRHSFFKSVLFHDDLLFLDRAWAKNFVTLYKKELNIPFSCNSRPELIDEEVVDLLKGAGCFKLCIGIESGNDYIRNKILKRCIRTEQIRNAFRLCRSRGIEAYAFNMVGMPFEKPKNILETIKLNSEIHVDSFQVSIFYPYIGTELYALSKRESFLTDRTADDYLKDSILDMPTISRWQILMFRRYFIVFVRFYSILNRLPRFCYRLSIIVVDYFLTRSTVAYCLNIFYVFMQKQYRGLRRIPSLNKVSK